MRILFIIYFLVSSYSLQASVDHKSLIEKKVQQMVEKIDDKAIVVVDIEEGKEVSQLAITPFAVKNHLLNSNDYPKLVKAKLTIYTSNKELPDSFIEALNSYFKRYQIKPQLDVKEHSFFGQAGQTISFSWGTLAISLLGLLIIAGLFLGYRQRNQSAKELFGVLNENFEKLAQSSPTSQVEAQRAQSTNTDNTSQITLVNDTFWKDITPDHLVALLSDCYWSSEDGYAKYIWSKLSIDQKMQVLGRFSYMKSYVDSFNHVSAIDLKLADDSYYLDPLDITNIANEELAKLVSDHPIIYNYLPAIRTKHLSLAVEQKLQLVTEEMNDVDYKNLVSNLDKAGPRVFSHHYTFEFTNDEEEIFVLQSNEISYDFVKSFPSLGWLTKLERPVACEILDQFAVKDLAQAWDAPMEILGQLESLLPDKKRDLLNGYLQRSSASRSNPVFSKIIEAILKTQISDDNFKEVS